MDFYRNSVIEENLHNDSSAWQKISFYQRLKFIAKWSFGDRKNAQGEDPAQRTEAKKDASNSDKRLPIGSVNDTHIKKKPRRRTRKTSTEIRLKNVTLRLKENYRVVY